jgi:pimeloyl-ACP methyl ester carboxylesterase
MPDMRTGAPTVVLAHGAFADGSSWNGVIERLQARGIPTIAAAVALRGPASDTAYLVDVIAEVQGQVIAVGHSYSGALISMAAARATNIVGLVYVAAFAPLEGEQLGVVSATSKDSILGTSLRPHDYAASGGGATPSEFTVLMDRFGASFANDISVAQAAVLAATQRPIAQAAFTEVIGPVVGSGIPAWAVVATRDKAAGADLTRSMAQRAGAQITEVDASHLVMITHPDAVAAVILQAVDAVNTVGATR